MANKRNVSDGSSGRRSLGRQREEATFPIAAPLSHLPRDYVAFFHEIKQRIQQERLKAVLAANAAMVLLYWDIGRSILERQEHEGWGAQVIDRLSVDLQRAFPDMRGFSPRNLKYMRAFASAWPDRAIVQEALAQIAQALFNSWFVDFDPVKAKAEVGDPGLPKHIADLFPDGFQDSELGEIPKGWRVGAFYDIAEITSGKRPENRS